MPKIIVPSSEPIGELPILPLRDAVIFPHMALPLTVERPAAIKLIEEVSAGDKILGVVAMKDGKKEVPAVNNVYRIGTVCRILQVLKQPSGQLIVLIHGQERFRIERWIRRRPYWKAKIEQLPDQYEKSKELEARTVNLKNLALRIVKSSPDLPEEVSRAILQITEPGALLDLLAGVLNIKKKQKQEILETLDIEQRFKKLTRILTHQCEVLDLCDKIQSQVQESIGKSQKEVYLREQLRAIQKELGEEDERKLEVREFAEKIEKAQMPEEAEQEALKQLKYLEIGHPASPQYGVVRTYLEWLTDLPWSKSTPDRLELRRAERVLDEDHFDLEKVKKRILESLAVRKLKADPRGPILCFVGPPGTGKTSLGRSIARAMGRKFIRMSLGGVRDEAEIRGHRRTYIGALPGRIIQSLRKAGSNNPVFMLDEVDKIGADFRGDPASALLEVLDPEQNYAFSDHYLEVPFDLSRVMFITTANILAPIPPPLLDRMEVLELPGYTQEEKLAIARKFLIPKQLVEHGLKKSQLKIRVPALREIISSYTREAGLRNLEREIAAVCRAVARKIVEEEEKQYTVGPADLEEYLGPVKFIPEVAERTAATGVSTGLAWTPAGGQLIFVEATTMPGKGVLHLTGQLGEVMKESAQAALSFLRSQGDDLGLDSDYFNQHDIHIHVPAGAIKKDGPSAGVAIYCALFSLLSGRKVKSEVAMTGEISLRGQVLPVGGIKEKVLAAARAGIKTVIIPEQNEKDLADLPETVRGKLKFKPVKRMDQAREVALEP